MNQYFYNNPIFCGVDILVSITYGEGFQSQLTNYGFKMIVALQVLDVSSI
jgi:hypothetical protein